MTYYIDKYGKKRTTYPLFKLIDDESAKNMRAVIKNMKLK